MPTEFYIKHVYKENVIEISTNAQFWFSQWVYFTPTKTNFKKLCPDDYFFTLTDFYLAYRIL